MKFIRQLQVGTELSVSKLNLVADKYRVKTSVVSQVYEFFIRRVPAFSLIFISFDGDIFKTNRANVRQRADRKECIYPETILL